jgi:hypothetical protein
VYVRVPESTPENDIALIGETIELKNDESGAATRNAPKRRRA